MGSRTAHAARIELPPIPPHPIPVDQVVVEIRPDPANRGGRLVLQDGVESSYIDILEPSRLAFEYQRHVAGIVDATHPRRRPLSGFQIGGGPCAVPRYLDATRRDARLTVVELDPGVIDIALEHLGLVPSGRLAVQIGDGRAALERVPDASLDVVIVDAFLGIVVPHHLMTSEFVAAARRTLRSGGVQVVNMIDIPPMGYAAAASATLLEAFPHVAVVADPATIARASAGNVVLAGSDEPLPIEHIARRASRDADPWQVLAGRSLERWVGDAAPLRDGVEPTHDLARLGPLFGRTRRSGRGGAG